MTDGPIKELKMGHRVDYCRLFMSDGDYLRSKQKAKKDDMSCDVAARQMIHMKCHVFFFFFFFCFFFFCSLKNTMS